VLARVLAGKDAMESKHFSHMPGTGVTESCSERSRLGRKRRMALVIRTKSSCDAIELLRSPAVTEEAVLSAHTSKYCASCFDAPPINAMQSFISWVRGKLVLQ
jgi:hypothetical protein